MAYYGKSQLIHAMNLLM